MIGIIFIYFVLVSVNRTLSPENVSLLTCLKVLRATTNNLQYLSSLRLKQSQQELVELKRKADQEAREMKKEEEKKQEEEAKKVTALESTTEKETKGENQRRVAVAIKQASFLENLS